MTLQDKMDWGKFTFSAALHKSGDIVFNYYSIPVSVKTILDDIHPVKIGLSDAYIIDKVIVRKYCYVIEGVQHPIIMLSNMV